MCTCTRFIDGEEDCGEDFEEDYDATGSGGYDMSAKSYDFSGSGMPDNSRRR